MDLAYWWSCIGKGLRLQPAQQACLDWFQQDEGGEEGRGGQEEQGTGATAQ